jgi:TRAP-type C4-dicarboxylate transport system substrate-binding protein
MFRHFLRIATTALILLPAMAAAEPITLKLSFFTSDRSNIYRNQIKPFVDAVNNDGEGLIKIEVYFSGTISKIQAEQPQLVADGTADMALIVPGRTPDRFDDIAIMELPGIYRDSREASLVFTRLIQARALKGYNDFFVISAFVAAAESIHSRKPIATNSDLKGLTIRTNNQIEAYVLKKLGAIPVPIPINQTTETISIGKIDGATFPPSMLFEFGIGRVTSHHYMIQLGGAPSALVMNRKKFESLPPKAQAVIRNYSGQWPAERSVTAMDALDKLTLEQIKSDPRRTVVFPSPSDLESTQRVFASVVEEWAAQSPHNRELLARVRVEIAKLHSPN